MGAHISGEIPRGIKEISRLIPKSLNGAGRLSGRHPAELATAGPAARPI